MDSPYHKVKNGRIVEYIVCKTMYLQPYANCLLYQTYNVFMQLGIIKYTYIHNRKAVYSNEVAYLQARSPPTT